MFIFYQATTASILRKGLVRVTRPGSPATVKLLTTNRNMRKHWRSEFSIKRLQQMEHCHPKFLPSVKMSSWTTFRGGAGSITDRTLKSLSFFLSSCDHRRHRRIPYRTSGPNDAARPLLPTSCARSNMVQHLIATPTTFSTDIFASRASWRSLTSRENTIKAKGLLLQQRSSAVPPVVTLFGRKHAASGSLDGSPSYGVSFK